MGCSHSIPDNHPSMFRAKNVDDNDKTQNCVYLEVKSHNLFIHSKYKKMMASWPISCLQRYGFNDEVLLIETGHGCDTGQGLFLFKCHRATQVFEKIKEAWSEIQTQNARAYPHISYPHQMSIMTGTTAVPSTSYYNTAGSGRDGVPLTAGLSSVSGRPSTNSRCTPPTPGTRGSASSHNTGSQRSLPGTFELQPAPVGRQEMLDRRRINSNAVSFNRQNESVHISHTRHHTVAADCDYENQEIVNQHKNNERTRTTGNTVTYIANSEHVTFENGSPDMPPRGVSANSLRSDEHVPLTPISNSTSGIGSLNGNSTTSESKCNGGISIPSSSNSTGNPQPPPIPSADPWRKQNGLARKPRKSHPRRLRHFNDFSRLSPGMPLSARDYVNTANARLDVGGTPLPATAAVGGGNHFSFDFDPRIMLTHNGNGFSHNHNINYVPIEVSTKNGDFYSCGASSASSGLPGTPLTPRTPGGQHFACDYAEIDHHKTRALSKSIRSRQREKKSRHTSAETSGLMNGNP